MKKLLTLVIISLATTLTVWGQIVITGTVISKDSNEAIPGVDVIEKDTNNRTMTNVDGTFSIEVDNLNSTLIFSFVGMVTKEYPLDGQKQIVVKTKWDCNKDFFDSQQIGVLFNTGVINTPIGGQIELASPWVLGGVLKGSYSYQTNLSENIYHNGKIEFAHYISNCDFDIDFSWNYRNVSFDNSINYLVNSIESDLNIRNIKLIAGYTQLDFSKIDEINEGKLSGMLIGFGTYFNMPLYPSFEAKISFYKNKIEYQASIEGSHKWFQCFMKFYKLNTFNELSIGIGTLIGYRLKRQK